jgi:hypothetical protein
VDVQGRGENVKTAAQATRRADRYLQAIDTEFDRITVSMLVAAANVNAVMPFMRMQVKFEHLPGYESDYIWRRVAERTVHDIFPDGTYELRLTLVGATLEAFTGAGDGDGDEIGGAIYALLSGSSGPYPNPSGYLLWDKTGDDIAPAYATSGPFTIVASSVSWPPHYGIQIDDDGTINAVLVASAIGIMWGERTPYTVKWELMLNNAVVADEEIISGPPPTGTDLAVWASWGPTVSVTSLAVSNGDVLWGRLSCFGSDGVEMAYFRSPWGVNPGTNNNRIEITGGNFP